MAGVEQARVFVFPLLHKFGTRGKIWRNTHLVWVAVSCEIRNEEERIPKLAVFTIYYEGVPITSRSQGLSLELTKI